MTDMLKVSHFGKSGDLVYALPVLRALNRIHGKPIHLLTAGSCWQFVPLLWEQPYIGEVDLEDTKAHCTVPITRGAIFPYWEWYKGDEGVNLSLQPQYFSDVAPVSWTRCYMQAAGVQHLEPSDLVALPTLINHRRWLYGVEVTTNGVKSQLPKTVVLAPETDTLDELTASVWQRLIDELREAGYASIITGTRCLMELEDCTDLRGLTSVPVLARIIAEASGFIGAHSFPWHLARHSETPAICLQTWRDGLRRCLPIDTKYCWMEPSDIDHVVEKLLTISQPDMVTA